MPLLNVLIGESLDMSFGLAIAFLCTPAFYLAVYSLDGEFSELFGPLLSSSS